MSRWQEATPGIERAKCVMRPSKDGDQYFYGRLHNTVKCEGWRRYGFVTPISGANNVWRYRDNVMDSSRIISAARAERAVETQTFLDICADEGLRALREREGEGGELTWSVFPQVGFLPFGRAKSLRGAYLNYHTVARDAMRPDDHA